MIIHETKITLIEKKLKKNHKINIFFKKIISNDEIGKKK
jgi:hypothetical protein